MLKIGIELAGDKSPLSEKPIEYIKAVGIVKDILEDDSFTNIGVASVLVNAYSVFIQMAPPEVREDLVLILERSCFEMRHADWDELDKLNEGAGGE